MSDATNGGTRADVTTAHAVHQDSDGTEVARAVTIRRPRDQLYAFWRDFSNLQPLMDNIERIEVLDDRRSRWTVKGPTGSVEWESVVTADEPGRWIAWEAVEEADVKNRGWVEFRDGPLGRGTEVRAFIEYDAPGGFLGRLIAKATGKEPNTQLRRELRRFKQLMETGEITRSDSPHGDRRGFPKI